MSWATLRMWAEVYATAVETQIAVGHRMRRHATPEQIAETVLPYKREQERIGRTLAKVFRQTAPAGIIAWQQASRGVGEQTLARLLGSIGDPVVATPHAWMETPPAEHECDDRCGKRHLVAFEPYERTVSQLWAYCGIGDPAIKKHKDMTQAEAMALGSRHRRMLVHLMVESVCKASSKPTPYYHDVLLPRREHYARTHPEWTPLHNLNAAKRDTGKVILKDLWRAARGEIAADHPTCDAHASGVGSTILTGDHKGDDAHPTLVAGDPSAQAPIERAPTKAPSAPAQPIAPGHGLGDAQTNFAGSTFEPTPKSESTTNPTAASAHTRKRKAA